uniref:Uncharacterized protein n=1 Tax=viral metagenome TaxID=1070528 RepID=A0A6C0E9X2_9ZZZZ
MNQERNECKYVLPILCGFMIVAGIQLFVEKISENDIVRGVIAGISTSLMVIYVIWHLFGYKIKTFFDNLLTRWRTRHHIENATDDPNLRLNTSIEIREVNTTDV